MNMMKGLNLRKIIMNWSISLIAVIISSFIIGCCKYVGAPEIPKLGGKCEDDMKKIMRQYILPDQKRRHCKG